MIITTPLINAIKGGHIDAVGLLLDYEANINKGAFYSHKTYTSYTSPLKCAILNDQIEILRLLLDRGVNTDLFREYDDIIDTLRHHPKVFEEVIARKISLYDRDINGEQWPLLRDVVEARWVEGIHIAIRQSANVNHIFDTGDTYRVEAIGWNGPTDIYDRHTSLGNTTALHLASFIGHYESVIALQHHDADKTICDSNGLTARDIAIMCHNFRIAKLLS